MLKNNHVLVIATNNKTGEYWAIYCDKKCATQGGIDLKKFSLEKLTQEEFDAINYPEDAIDKGGYWETPDGDALPIFGHCCSNMEFCGELISS